MSAQWKPGQPIPEHFSGMTVMFAWNEVALTSLLDALKKGYPTGYASMVAHIREAMQNHTPPRPDEPMGLAAVVEDKDGSLLIRHDRTTRPWTEARSGSIWDWSDIAVVRVLSEGVSDA